MQDPDVPSSVDLMFRAVADLTRLRILCLLHRRELCVGDIVDILQVAQPKTSRHLAHLRKAGLVNVRKSGLWSYYFLSPAKTDFHEKLLLCLDNCIPEIPQIQSDLARASALEKLGRSCVPL